MKLLPNISEALRALDVANSKNQETNSPSTLKSYLKKLQLVDPRLGGYIRVRKAAIASFTWDILPISEDESDVSKAKEVKTRLKNVIDYIIINHVNTFLYDSWAIKLEWDRVKNKVKVKEDLPPEYLQCMMDKNKYPSGLAYYYEDKYNHLMKQPVPVGDPDWVYDTDYDGNSSGGALATILIPEIMRSTAIQQWEKFNKKLQGLAIARWERGASPEDKLAARDSVKQLSETSYSATSKDIEYSFQRMVDATGAESYEKAKKDIEADIAIAIKGEANTALLPNTGGSRAALQVQQQIGQDIIWFSLEKIKSLINNQLLINDYLVQHSKEPESELNYYFKFIDNETADFETNARTLEILQRANIPLLKHEVYNNVGYSIPKQGEDILEPQLNLSL